MLSVPSFATECAYWRWVTIRYFPYAKTRWHRYSSVAMGFWWEGITGIKYYVGLARSCLRLAAQGARLHGSSNPCSPANDRSVILYLRFRRGDVYRHFKEQYLDSSRTKPEVATSLAISDTGSNTNSSPHSAPISSRWPPPALPFGFLRGAKLVGN